MDKLDSLKQRIENIQSTLNITNNDQEEIDNAFENWLVSTLNKKLNEKGMLQDEK